MNHRTTRWKVACVNWGNDDPIAFKALAYRAIGNEGCGWKYFITHAEAIAYADSQARALARDIEEVEAAS